MDSASELLLIPGPVPISDGDSAPLAIIAITRGARIDLLFTMSDNARARRQSRERADKFLDERAFFISRALRRTPATASRIEVWWSQTGSNRRPPACKAGALPTELWPRCAAESRSREIQKLVGLGRLERPTSPLSGVRSNHLSYRPERTRTDTRHRPASARLERAQARCNVGSSAKKEKRRRRRPA